MIACANAEVTPSTGFLLTMATSAPAVRERVAACEGVMANAVLAAAMDRLSVRIRTVAPAWARSVRRAVGDSPAGNEASVRPGTRECPMITASS